MLCSEENSTYAAFSLDKQGLTSLLGLVGRNKFVGYLGKCYDDVFIKRSLRKCLILGSAEHGIRLPNSTYTGVLGWLQSKRVELYLRSQPEYLHEDWIQKSWPVNMESVIVAQTIKDQNDDVKIFNLLDNFKVDFTLILVYLFAFCCILVLSFLLNEFSHRVRFGIGRTAKVSEKIISAVRSFGNNRLSAISLFALCVGQFIWLTELFLTNNIKTNKVVVDTSRLIKDDNEMFTTEKTACLLKDGQIHAMITSSPNRDVLSRIFYEKTLLKPEMEMERKMLGEERCLISRNIPMTKLLEASLDDFFLVIQRQTRNTLLGTSFLLGRVFKMMWISEKKVYEYPKVYYYDGNKPEIGKSLTRHIESGIFRKMFDCLDKTAIGCARSAKIELFDSLASYVENYSGFSNLVFENFKHIFIYYGLICSLVFAAFCVHHLIKFLEKRIILLPSPLREFFPRFAPRRRVVLQRKHNVGRDSFYRFRPIRPVAHWAKHRKVS